MFLLRDVFEELSILSLVFQANSTTLSIVMQALETACLNREWPDTADDLATFGNESLTYLSQHVRTLLTSNNCEVDQLQHEWQQVKVFTRRQAMSNPTQHPHAIWKKVLTSEIDRFENIGHIIEMIMVLPLSTAVVERGFSAISRIKLESEPPHRHTAKANAHRDGGSGGFRIQSRRGC